METKLYKGKVILKFNEKKHVYTVDDKIVYGVTGIISIISKPVLINWAVKLTKEKVYSEAVRLGGNEFVKSLKEVLLTAGKEHYAVSKEARETGTEIHKIPEGILSGEKDIGTILERVEKTEVKLGALAFMQFQSKHKLKPQFLEKKVFSIKHGYAGTVDYYGELDGKITVLDWKSSKAIYDDYLIQVSAYANALVEEGYKVDQTAVVRLGKDGTFEIKIEKDWKKHLPAFLGAKEIYEHQMMMKGNNFDKRKETKVVKKITKK